jgi:hypothetical protein
VREREMTEPIINKEKNKKQLEAEALDIESEAAKQFIESFQETKSIIVYIFSSFVLNFLVNLEFQGEIILIVFLVVVFWFCINKLILFLASQSFAYKNHKQWFEILKSFTHFLRNLGLYLFLQLISNDIVADWQQGYLSLEESIVTGLVIILLLLTWLQIFSDLLFWKKK